MLAEIQDIWDGLREASRGKVEGFYAAQFGRQERIQFYESLMGVLEDGIPIEEALETVERAFSNGGRDLHPVSIVCNEVAMGVRGGKTLADAWELIDFVFVEEIAYDPAMLVAKGLDPAGSLAALEAAQRVLAEVPFTEAALEPALRDLAASLGLKTGQLFGIVRVATSGKAVAPPLFGSLVALGRERTLARCAEAAQKLRSLITATQA